MKKWIALLLTGMMSLSLLACGGKQGNTDANQGTTEGLQEDNSADEETSAIVVHIRINPEFEIHVNKDGNVWKVMCLNEDARAVVDKVYVEGKSCEDATYEIVKEAMNQGYLKDHAAIEVMVSFSPETVNQMDVWMETVENSVMQVLAENDISAELVFDSKVVEPGEESNPEESESTEANLPETTTGETDANLSETTTEEIDADGNTIIREENGNVLVVNKEGKVLQITEPDGVITYMSYDANGDLATQEIHDFMGVITVRRYDGKGKLVSEETNEPSGNQTILKYDENGNLVSEERIQQNQTYLYTYRSDGSVASEIEQQADGFRRERYYHENGTLSREYQLWADGLYKDDYFDQNGKPTQANFRNADGGVEERTYRPDGTSYGYYYDPNGAVFYYEFDANGKQLLDTHKQVK